MVLRSCFWLTPQETSYVWKTTKAIALSRHIAFRPIKIFLISFFTTDVYSSRYLQLPLFSALTYSYYTECKSHLSTWYAIVLFSRVIPMIMCVENEWLDSLYGARERN